MSVWFEGRRDVDRDLLTVQRSFEGHGEHYVGVIGLLPGLTSVELVEDGRDSVTIRTNEGLMKRTNLSKRIEADRMVVEFDEVYEAGSKVTVTSHFAEECAVSANGVTYRIVISDVEAPGILGFFYRKFGSSKMGNALLTASKAYLERQAD